MKKQGPTENPRVSVENTMVVRPQDYEVPQDALDLLPREEAVRFSVCPLAYHEQGPRGGRTLVLACADVHNLPASDELQRMVGCRLQLMPASEQDVLLAIAVHYAIPTDTFRASTPLASGAHDTTQLLEEDSVEDADMPSAKRLLENIIRSAISERATDIHLEPYRHNVFARFRIDGILTDHMTYDMALHPAVMSRLKILTSLDIAQKRLPQDGRFDVQIGSRPFDIRVSVVPILGGESAVLRLLPKGSLDMTLSDLGLSQKNMDMLQRLIHQPFGMVLTTGPTGSGKTTTLYASMGHIDVQSKKVITVEDPIEYQFERISQIQTNAKIGLTFAAGLRSILRQDPDIIVVGEIRDLETLDMAIHAALTGHLVLSTMHCNDVAAAAARMVDMGAEPFLVASSISGLVAQRLVRRICSECKEPVVVSPETRKRLNLPDDSAIFYHGRGCDKCRGTGYYHRISLFEVMPMTTEVHQAIVRKAGVTEMREVIHALGIASLRDDGIEKARQGITTLEEVMRAVYVDGLS